MARFEEVSDRTFALSSACRRNVLFLHHCWLLDENTAYTGWFSARGCWLQLSALRRCVFFCLAYTNRCVIKKCISFRFNSEEFRGLLKVYFDCKRTCDIWWRLVITKLCGRLKEKSFFRGLLLRQTNLLPLAAHAASATRDVYMTSTPRSHKTRPGRPAGRCCYCHSGQHLSLLRVASSRVPRAPLATLLPVPSF